jgi:hypothetical protein
MPLASRVVSLLTITLSALSPVTAHAQAAEPPERIAASFVLALGRGPTADEIVRWTQPQSLSLANLLARQREQLQADPTMQRAVIVKAWQDAFGRTPGEDETKAASGGTYTEQMQRHLRRLTAHPEEYEQVLQRAYRFLLQRDAYTLEVDYWKQQGSFSYALLVGCVEDWARRNQPGLMVTTGIPTVSVNSRYMVTVRLSPAVAAEARAAVGLVAADPVFAIAAGRNLLAAGAAGITSNGGIHFVAAGAADLVP